MKNLYPLIIILFFCLNIFSQKEANNWYFGDGAGIQFNSDGSTTSLSDGVIATEEGCTTISDVNGNLIFYTDGITVWNKNHQPMPNANPFSGSGLLGDPSSTQSAIIVPKPEDSNIYYIFTVDTSVGNLLTDPDTGFNYSTVDLRLDGGLGDVISTEKNINLLNDSSEKISAVLKDCVSKSIWVITFASSTGNPNQFFDTFYAYEVSSSGISTTPVKSSFNIQIGDPRGYLKLSPDGTKLACANSVFGLFLYDFDAITGKVSNQEQIQINFSPIGKPQIPYGIEFSQNNELLYVSTFFNSPNPADFTNPSSQYGALLQYNLKASNISASEVVIDEKQLYRGALQLGPNGKIYRAMNIIYDIGTPFLSVINNPNKLGLACGYQENAVALSKNSRQGLPPFITSFFSEKINITQKESNFTYLPLCIGENYTLEAKSIPGATYTWSKDDVILPSPSPNHIFDINNGPGLYKVLIQNSSGNCGDLLEGEALVKYFSPPNANSINTIKICDDNNDGKSNFNFVEQTNEALGIQDPSIYEVKYFTSQEDADGNKNEITLPFENTQTSQRIYTRVGIIDNTTCFDTSESFLIEVFNKPSIHKTPSSTEVCDKESPFDLNTSNGITTIDLHQFDSDIIGNQDTSKYTINYFENKNDAENNINVLDYNYTNNTPFKQIIYARIENKSNIDCYSISEPFEIIVNPLPTFSNAVLVQCDEDGNDDQQTSFNLLESKETLTNNETSRSVKFFKSFNTLTNELSDEIINSENYINDANPQSLFVQIINNDTQCYNIANLTLEISTTKIDDYTPPPLCDELGSEDGINIFNLDQITTDIHLINNITFPITYYETYEDALSESRVLPSMYKNTKAYNQIIYARAENNNACYGISKVTLKVNTLPNIITEDLEPTYYCLNKYPERISINASLINDAPSNYFYNWSNGASTYSIDINKPTIYTVKVTNKLTGCTKTRTINVEASNIASFNMPSHKIVDVSSNNSITVFVSGQGTYQYAIYDKENLNVYRDYQDSNLFENVYPGAYNIRVNDIKNNCGYVSEKVFVIGFPKLFTPNGDGINDTWQLYGITNNILQVKSKILVFDRYGKLIKQLTPNGDGWNGRFNGLILPSDDYWFAVTLQDGRVFKGHFTLKR